MRADTTAFGVESFARRRVALGHRRVEFEDGSPVPLADLTAQVPCAGCTACCRGMTVALAERESDEGLSVELVAGVRRLRRRADGSCVHLIDDRCAVYDRRPLACRVFDCRDFAVARVTPTNHAGLAAAVRRWRPEVRTVDDRRARERIVAVAHALIAAGADACTAIATAMIFRKHSPTDALREAVQRMGAS